MVAGLVLKARPYGTSPKPAAVRNLHRFLALLGLGALVVHGLALLLDRTVPFHVADLLVPGIAPYRPVWTGLGVLAAELMLLVYVSFSLRKRIGTRAGAACAGSRHPILATAHGLLAGTDSGTAWALALYGGAVGAVLAAAAWRIVVPPSRASSFPSRLRASSDAGSPAEA